MAEKLPKEYSGFYVEILVEFMQDMPEDTVELIYDEADKEDRSGIATFRDFVIAHVGRLEKFLLSKVGSDYLDGFFVEIVQTYCDLLACKLEEDPQRVYSWLPSASDIKKHYNLCLKREGCLGWFEFQHKPKKKEETCSTKSTPRQSSTSS